MKVGRTNSGKRVKDILDDSEREKYVKDVQFDATDCYDAHCLFQYLGTREVRHNGRTTLYRNYEQQSKYYLSLAMAEAGEVKERLHIRTVFEIRKHGEQLAEKEFRDD